VAKYQIVHNSKYRLSGEGKLESAKLYLIPKSDTRQKLLYYKFSSTPLSEYTEQQDRFKNTYLNLSIPASFESLKISFFSEVEVIGSVPPLSYFAVSWEQLISGLALSKNVLPYQFLDTNLTLEEQQVLAEFVSNQTKNNATIGSNLQRILELLNKECVYDTSATTPYTSVMEFFKKRRGVCQDMARLLIACFRSIGVPARYVSGYMLTEEDSARILGAHTHAWVSIFIPRYGWLDLDPTNACVINERYIELAHGPDYFDIAPVSGSILGSQTQIMDVSIDLKKIA